MGPVTLSPASGNASPVPIVTVGNLTFSAGCSGDAYGAQAFLWLSSSVAHAAYTALVFSTVRTYTETYASGDTGTGNNTLAQESNPAGVPLFLTVVGSALSSTGQQVFYNLHIAQNARGATDNKCIVGGSFVVT